MRLLLTNHRLAQRTGTELFTQELALELRSRGHEIAVLTWEIGPLAEPLEAPGIVVVTRPEALPWVPELIHGQHHLTTMAALAASPGVPGLYHCHGYAPWEEQPPRHPRLRAYVGTAEQMRKWLGGATGAPPERVHVVENGVNLDRFRVRTEPLPPIPRRALLFDNYAKEGPALEILRAACTERGIELVVAGRECGHPLAEPEAALPRFDLVFAVGRSALEAMACGCAVATLSTAGVGTFISSATLPAARRINFTVPHGASPLSHEAVLACLEQYDAEAAAQVSREVRATMNLARMVDQLEAIYRGILAEPAPPNNPDAEIAAMASYLATLGPYVCEKDERFNRLRRDRDRAKRALAEYKHRAGRKPEKRVAWWQLFARHRK